MKVKERWICQMVILQLLSAGLAYSQADTHISDFSDGINPSYWEVKTNQELYVVDDSQGDVRISKPYGGSYSFQYISLNFRQQIKGDFDVRVDYRDINIDRVDGSPGNQVQLNAFFGGQTFCVVRSDEVGFPTGHNRHIWADPPGQWFGAQADTSVQGTMRITRNGTWVTGYIDDVAIYSQHYNTEPASLAFPVQNHHTKDAVSVTFDNFHITADEIVAYPGDLNNDSCVNLFDFALLANEWLNSNCLESNNYCCGADQNGSGTVNIEDLTELILHWLVCFDEN